MSQPNKPDPRGFKPGANMPQDGYDPHQEGMSPSGNHASGHTGNDTPYGDLKPGEHGQPEHTEEALREQDNQNRNAHRNGDFSDNPPPDAKR